MPKQQSSLDSFFSTGKPVKKQKTLTSFFNKENSQNKDDPKDNDDDDDDDNDNDTTGAVVVKRPSPKGGLVAVAAAVAVNKRRVIVDDDDSDEEDNAKVAADEARTTTTTTKVEAAHNTISKPDDTTTNNNNNKAAACPASQKPNNPENENKAATKSVTKPPKTNHDAVAVADTSMSSLKDDNDNSSTSSSSPVIRKLQAQASKLVQQAKVASNDKLPSLSSPVLYQDLVQVLEQIEALSGRLEIQALLTTFLRRLLQCSPKDLYSVLYLCTSSIAPAYECVELGIGDSILMKAIGDSYGTKAANVKQLYEAEGDLGNVAKHYKSKHRTLAFGMKPKPLTVAHVLETFRKIANIAGASSQKLKVQLIQRMLVAAQEPAETKYIIRGLQGKLRIGLAQSTVLISLAHALAFTLPSTVQESTMLETTSMIQTTGTKASRKETTTDDEEEDDIRVDVEAAGMDTTTGEEKNIQLYQDASAPIEKRLEAAVNIVKQVYSEVPSYDALLDAALQVPLVALHDACSFQPGIPVVPMLAKPTKSIQEVLNRLEGVAFTCEYKYDGERAQIHKMADGTVKVFSRNLLETSSKYPEVPLFVQEAVAEGSQVESFVLDAEVVAYNPQTGMLVPFQVLSTRKKTEESAETAKVQVIVQGFDLMYFNGKSLLTTRLEERRALLKQHFLPVKGKFEYAKSLDFDNREEGSGDTTALEQFLDAAVKGQCEGLMVKTMDDVYEPSRRSLNWLKLKKDYLEGLGDSFDLVPIGAYHGRGKRTGVYGAYLLACYDEETEEFQSVCKIGTGFSDEDLQSLSAELNKHKLPEKSSQYNVSDSLECDVWFEAVQVWEVKAADLSKSSAHRGAIGKTGEAGRGIGLRFPRFERIREDKNPDQATNSDQVLDIYYNQDTVKGQEQDEDDDDGI